jgi:hypothetical protein
LADDTYRLVIHLQPGDTIVVANQVCNMLYLLFTVFFYILLLTEISLYRDVYMDDIVLSQVPKHHELLWDVMSVKTN